MQGQYPRAPCFFAIILDFSSHPLSLFRELCVIMGKTDGQLVQPRTPKSLCLGCCYNSKQVQQVDRHYHFLGDSQYTKEQKGQFQHSRAIAFKAFQSERIRLLLTLWRPSLRQWSRIKTLTRAREMVPSAKCSSYKQKDLNVDPQNAHGGRTELILKIVL